MILKYIIAPVITAIGYRPVRADQISEPGLISNQVIRHLVNSQLVIADLTGHNPNVFYELAIRHFVNKPLVQIIKKGEKIPFDVADTRLILFDLDLESAQIAKEDLENQIKALQNRKFKVETPISAALREAGIEGNLSPNISGTETDD